MTDVERDGIWHIVARADGDEAVTVGGLRIVQQTHLWAASAESGVLPVQGGLN